MKILVTGGSGFIGSALIHHILEEEGEHEVINLDKLTYAAAPGNLSDVEALPAYRFEQADICDATAMKRIFRDHEPDAVMHLAAESHVDRSIDGPAAFMETNILGTYHLLEAALDFYRGLKGEKREHFRFHHVSTDEVFGSLGHDGVFKETTPYAPRSPYSASKASSDHLAAAWHHTFGLPVVTSNCSNNYGPRQFPEKLVPLMIISALHGRPLPVYGKGENVRDWLFVDDHASALFTIARKGRLGETYLVGGRAERSNLEVVKTLCAILDDMLPDSPHRPHEGLITFVEDRPGHDLRYAIDPSKTETELDWSPSVGFEEGLRRTVSWYLDNEDWWRPLMDERYHGERLGLGTGGKQ